MLVTLLGIVTLVMLEQSLNALSLMLVTLSKIATFVMLVYESGKIVLRVESHTH